MKRKIFIRFFAVTLVSVLFMFVFGLVAVNLNTRNIIDRRLKEETELAASLIQTESDFSTLAQYGDNDQLRITVTDTDGNVLFESDTTAELENHRDREEIKNALAGTPATARRYSHTFRCDMTYYATLTTLEDGSEIILRLAVPTSQISAYITALIPLLIVVLAVALVISFLMSNVLSKSISSKITVIADSLKSLNDRQYIPIKTNTGEPELFAVLNQINELNVNIHSHISVADRERLVLNTVLNNVSQSIIALDDKRRTVFANKSAYAMFGSNSSAVGQDLIFLIDKSEIYKILVEKQGTDHAFGCEYEGKILSAVIRRVEGEGISSIVIFTDITKEKLVEKQKIDFFANASHELKTPITVMQGLSELIINKEGLDEGSKKQIERIHKESLRLGSLISDMLMLSRIEGGETVEESVAPISIATVAAEIIGEFSEEIGRRRITARVEGDATVTVNERMAFELVENLISNAVKYNREGGSVTVTVTERDGRVRLQVSDSGIGIDKEHLPRLCERFYRVDKSHSKRTGGTGLGLAIVKHICVAIGAEMNIESRLGVGTDVTVTFAKEKDR